MDDKLRIQAAAQALGFQHMRVARIPAGGTPWMQEYLQWLQLGRHGTLEYMARNLDVRANPSERLPKARSVVVLAMDHHHQRPPDPGGLTGKVARYAWGRDYHNLAGKRLKKLLRGLREQGLNCWGGVDTAPLFERAWAQAAGLGFSGKSCLSIIPARGSWYVLAALVVELDLQPDSPLRDHCGSCQRCLVACPTDAFQGPHQLDARRCVAYWTIEQRGVIPEALRPGFGRWVFGCDVCQEVCPHNVAAPDAQEDDFLPRHAWLDLPELLDTGDEALMQRFLGTPLRRPGAQGLKRNACVVLGNLGDPAAVPSLRRAAEREGPVVVEHARWALERLGA